MTTPNMSGDITSDDKLWALLSWLFWPIGVIMLVMEDKKSRPFIKFHAITSLGLGVVTFVVTSILAALTAGIGGCLGLLVWAYALYLGIQAYGGKYVEVPLLTNFLKGQGWL